MDGENQLWVRGRIHESTPEGRNVAERIRNGTYAGLSLGMTHSVFRKPRPQSAGSGERLQQGNSAAQDEDEDDWSNIMGVMSSSIEEVSVCEEGKFENTILATFFSKNPDLVVPSLRGKSSAPLYGSRDGSSSSYSSSDSTCLQKPIDRNNNARVDINAALFSVLSPKQQERVAKFPSISTFSERGSTLSGPTPIKNDESETCGAEKMTSTMTTKASAAATAPSATPMSATSPGLSRPGSAAEKTMPATGSQQQQTPSFAKGKRAFFHFYHVHGYIHV